MEGIKSLLMALDQQKIEAAKIYSQLSKEKNKNNLTERRLEREKAARMQAEVILEKKALELYDANEQLMHLNENLELQIRDKLTELRESEQRYRQLIESIQDIIYKIGPDGVFTFVSSVVEKLLGYTEQEFIGKHFTDFVAPGYRKQLVEFYQTMLLERLDSTYTEFPVVAKDGRIVWIGQTVRLITNNNEISELVAVARDVSDRKLAEIQLQTTQTRLSTLITSLHSGVLVEDEQLRIILVNQLFCDIFDVKESPQQLIGREYFQGVGPFKHLMENPQEFAQKVEQLTLNRQASVGDEIRMVNGRILELDYVPIYYGEEFMGHLWKYSDVTEKYLARERIRRSEEKYRGIMNNMELGLLEVDNDQTIIRSYERFCKMIGYTEGELIGKNAIDLLVAPEFNSVINQQQRERQQGNAGAYELQLVKRDGSRIWMLVSGVPILDEEGAIVGSMGIHYDLDERKQLEEELIRAKQIADEARQAEKQFLANMSHEIRTPLNAIIGMSHLLFDTQPSRQQREYIDILKTSADFLHSLISDLLNMTKIEAGRIEVYARPFDLGGLLIAIKKVFAMKLQGRPISIDVYSDVSISGDFVGDDVMLNQILMNLIGNAEKFTEEGSIQVTARISKQEEDRNWIEFSVVDTGIGIPQEKLDLVFQKFKQVNPQGHKYKGTGLGLAITKELVELQGGTISVKSLVGHGSTFTFTLPFTKGKLPSEHSSIVGKELSTADDIKLGHILVVEDNLTNQKYISSLLAKWNISYSLVTNGKQAIEEAKKQKFDIILMDVQMPIMNGYEATVAIRSTHNLNQSSPIIALTASGMLDHKNIALEAGMNDFLTKPFEPTQLWSVLQRYTSSGLEKENINFIKDTLYKWGYDQDLDTGEILDYKLLLELYGNDTDYMINMFTVFLEDIAPEILNLTGKYNNEDWSNFAQLVHKSAPTFLMVGLPELKEKMDELLKIIKQGDSKQLINTYSTDIEEKLKNAIPVLNLFINAFQTRRSKNGE
jgi:PAS domain S-box-containing protein